jgi:fructose-1,6-bisphosphatase-3
LEITEGLVQKNKKYLELLSKQFPSILEASTEIINLQAILNLPKGTEHYLSDLHGEYEAFLHILKNGSGVVRRKIEDIFGSNITQYEKNMLATLIYYPEEVLKKRVIEEEDLSDWYEVMLHRLINVCRGVSSKYTRSKVRKALPKDYSYIIEELLHEQENAPNKFAYYDQIVKTIVDIGQADPFITALGELIQRLAIDRLHIIGDIYDRGPGAHIIMEKLIKYHSVDIQWGNHDISWIGAAAGSQVCIANTIRISARYGNLDTLEDGYGINLLPLANFAINTYDEIEDSFDPKEQDRFSEREANMIGKMHKAISIIMFKLEGQMILRNPNYEMENKLLLDKINYDNNTILLNGIKYSLNTTGFPTIDKNDPYKLSKEEQEVMTKLKTSYLKNEKLQRHIKFMLSKGSIYLVFNENLLFHGCIPMEDDGEFSKVKIDKREYKGRRLLDKLEKKVRKAYGSRGSSYQDINDLDIFWYLWTGENSSLFGKKRMTTFERYFINDSITHIEEKNPYYKWSNEEETCKRILAEFGLISKKSKIINGHVPVKVSKGEDPVKANGRLIVIDGGLAKAYQKVTGIAGYTLIFNSYGMLLAAHEPFESTECAVEKGIDIVSKLTILEASNGRIRVADTDIGKELQQDVFELKMLLEAYRKGIVKQKTKKRW